MLPVLSTIHRFLLLRIFCASAFLLLFPQLVSGQRTAALTDTTDLFDSRFFGDQTAAKLIRQAYTSEVPAKDSLSRIALASAQNSHDSVAQMAALALMGEAEYRRGNFRKAMDRFNESLSFDAALDSLSPVRERVFATIANCYSDLGARNMAAALLRDAIRINEERDKVPSIRLYHHYSDMAGTVQGTSSKDSAIYYYRKAISVAAQLKSSTWHSSALNNLGYLYLLSSQPDSAMRLFREAQQRLKLVNRSDSLFLGSITDNMGQAYEKMGQPAAALPLYEANYLRFRNSNDGLRFLNACIAQVRVLTQLHRFPEAAARLDEVLALARSRKNPLPHHSKLDILNAQLAFDAATGKNSEALAIAQHLNAISDSLLNVANEKKFTAMDYLLEEKSNRYKAQLQLEQVAKAEEQVTARYNRLLAAGIAVVSVLVLSILLVLYRRRIASARTQAKEESILRERAELDLQKEQFETEKLNRELELKQRDLTDMAVNITVRKKLTEEWLERLKKIKAAEDPSKALQQLIMELKNQDQGTEDKRLLPENVEQVNQEFFEKLQAAYPELTRSEIDLAVMLRMRLPSKEIASIRNISSHAVRVAKNRLKKKMNLGPDQDLDAFIARI